MAASQIFPNCNFEKHHTWNDRYGKVYGSSRPKCLQTGLIHDDAKSRAEFFAYELASIGISLIGDKGLSKLGTATKIVKAGKLGANTGSAWVISGILFKTCCNVEKATDKSLLQNRAHHKKNGNFLPPAWRLNRGCTSLQKQEEGHQFFSPACGDLSRLLLFPNPHGLFPRLNQNPKWAPYQSRAQSNLSCVPWIQYQRPPSSFSRSLFKKV